MDRNNVREPIVPQAAILQALAEAVTDGSDPDWASAESVAFDARERALIGHMRAVAQIGRVRATLDRRSSTGARRSPLGPETRRLLGTAQDSEKVGRGRFGDVYRAWDPTLDRQVALKILRHRDSSTDDVVEEGRLMARVRHPNVITIYGAQRIDGDTGLWMEFVHGRTLEAELAERGPLDAALSFVLV